MVYEARVDTRQRMALFKARTAIRTVVLAEIRMFVATSLMLWLGLLPSMAAQIQNSDCLACHNEVSFSTSVQGKPVSLYVSERLFQQSVHSTLSCTDCHADAKSIPHPTGLAKPSCGTCHTDEEAAYGRSVHGQAVLHGDANAAHCVDCHGEPHAILSSTDPASKVSHSNIPNTCGTCHQQTFVMRTSGVSTQVFVAYEQSVHGRAVSEGSQKAAVCTDCHGTHEILMAGDPKSSTFKFNVPSTCGKCHERESQQYVESIHGQAIHRGNWLAPVCTDCHGIHTIKAPNNPSSSVSGQALAQITCARCHQGVRLASEFGVPSARVASYQASYHGLASRLGSTVVANCASCHGSHLILPSSDPRSTINSANLTKTCGQCHPGATVKFTRFPVHAVMSPSADFGAALIAWVRKFYLGIIVFVVGAMLFHNLVIFGSKARGRKKSERRTIARMTLNQRVQHWILLSCFAVLVLTGFALIYPFSTFVDMIGITDPVRRIVHRIAGATLIAAGIYHVFYISFSRSGRQTVLALLPGTKDLWDIWRTLSFYLGLGAQKPQFGRFNYGEKFEYWALVWGTVVMACTGLMAWFQLTVTRFLPGWWVDLALTVHLYEAILATLAILIWHLYQVMFDPDVYPMNWSWWDGGMSLAHYKDEHALDSETILQALLGETEGADRKEGGEADAGAQNSNGNPSEEHKSESS
jgi:cytochrome b subunit of formate dehydrogenase